MKKNVIYKKIKKSEEKLKTTTDIIKKTTVKGFYINLDSRQDRNNHMKKLLKEFSFFSEIEKFSAIKDNNGALGCCLSHLKILEKIKLIDRDFFLILEDDFDIFNKKRFNAFIESFNKLPENSWDVIILTPICKKDKKIGDFYKIYDNQTTSGYIIKKNFIEKMIDNFTESKEKLIEAGDKSIENYSIDINWKKLQQNNNFLAYREPFARQLPSYSDILNKNVNYSNLFNRF